jgi:hypothetical protein
LLTLLTHLFSHWSIPLKGPKHEIFGSSFITPSKPIRLTE